MKTTASYVVKPAVFVNIKTEKKVYPYYDTCITIAYYKSATRDLILNLKYHNNKKAADLIAEMIYDKISSESYDNSLIIPVPATKSSVRKRGYNQSWLIAKRLGKLMQTETSNHILFKIRNTSAQKSLTESQRKKNLIKAFSVKNKFLLKGREIILVDDVITTGATLSECSKILKRSGAVKINAVTFAYTSFYNA